MINHVLDFISFFAVQIYDLSGLNVFQALISQLLNAMINHVFRSFSAVQIYDLSGVNVFQTSVVCVTAMSTESCLDTNSSNICLNESYWQWCRCSETWQKFVLPWPHLLPLLLLKRLSIYIDPQRFVKEAGYRERYLYINWSTLHRKRSLISPTLIQLSLLDGLKKLTGELISIPGGL